MAVYGVILLTTLYCAYTDLKNYLIYNKVTVPVFIGGIIYHTVLGNGFLFSIKGTIIGIFILILAAITKKIGEGDGKLLVAIGSWLGWLPTFLVLIIAMMLAAVWTLFIHLKKILNRKIPFGVCIFGGVILLGVVILSL
ncbi:A24 family peptidase [Peptococcaceae bacterium 1198_IL3148]